MDRFIVDSYLDKHDAQINFKSNMDRFIVAEQGTFGIQSAI